MRRGDTLNQVFSQLAQNKNSDITKYRKHTNGKNREPRDTLGPVSVGLALLCFLLASGLPRWLPPEPALPLGFITDRVSQARSASGAPNRLAHAQGTRCCPSPGLWQAGPCIGRPCCALSSDLLLSRAKDRSESPRTNRLCTPLYGPPLRHPPGAASRQQSPARSSGMRSGTPAQGRSRHVRLASRPAGCNG